MEITIRMTDNDLINPQLAVALATLLESRVDDGFVEDPSDSEAFVPKIIPMIKEEEVEGVPTDPEPEETTDPEPEEEPGSDEQKFQESLYEMDDLIKLANACAKHYGTSEKVIELVEKISGVKTITRDDDTYWQPIGLALQEVLDGEHNE